MTFSISEELKRTFDLAGLHNKAFKTLNAGEWNTYNKIAKKFDEQRRVEEQAFKAEYKTRFEVARKRLINKAGEKPKDFKHRWFGSDQFDKSAVNRQADRNVRTQHHQLMAGFDQKEAGEIKQLLDGSEHRQQAREKPLKDFENVTDRRGKDGLPEDRRQKRSRQRSR